MCGFCREADAGDLVVAGFYVAGVGLGSVLGPEVAGFEKTVCYANCAAWAG